MKVDAARKDLERTIADLEAEDRRIERCKGEIEACGDRLASADPDGDERVFARLVQARDAARGQLEAFAARRERKARAVEEAKAALEAAEQDAAAAARAEALAEVRKRAARIQAAFRQFHALLVAELPALRELAQRAVDPAEPKALNLLRREIRWLEPTAPMEIAAHVAREAL